jgi:16S rRNA (guanine527-N7)-methyltransferase
MGDDEALTLESGDGDDGRAPVVAGMLKRSADQGFLGGMPIEDQVAHARGFAAAAEGGLGRPPRSFLDLGTGGGLPGLVLAAVWPESRGVLLDANERRTSFLALEVGGLPRSSPLEVVRGRAEEAGHDPALVEGFEVVTARSFGTPGVTTECAAPLLVVGGLLVVSEPPDVVPGDRWPTDRLEVLGLRPSTAFRFLDRYGYQIIEKVGPTPERYPRRVGIPAKRPLF